MKDFKYGTATVPDNKRGPWKIDTFEIKDDDQFMLFNLRCVRDGNPMMQVHPGTYRRLSHEERGVVMSTTRMEILTSIHAWRQMKGSVLVSGLGLGMMVEGLLAKPEVTKVRVLEVDKDVIEMVSPHFMDDLRFEVLYEDAYLYKPKTGEAYDYAWHDIWDQIDADNLPLMTKLKRKWCKRIPTQFCWSQEMAQRQQRLYG